MYFVNHFQKTQVKQTNVCFILLLFERAIDLLDVAVDLVDVALERVEVALERVEVALDLVDVALDLVNVALDWCGTKMCRKCVTVVESGAQGPGPGSENVSKVCNCRQFQRPGPRLSRMCRKCGLYRRSRAQGPETLPCAQTSRAQGLPKSERDRNQSVTQVRWIRRPPPVDSLNGINSFLPLLASSSETLLGKTEK